MTILLHWLDKHERDIVWKVSKCTAALARGAV